VCAVCVFVRYVCMFGMCVRVCLFGVCSVADDKELEGLDGMCVCLFVCVCKRCVCERVSEREKERGESVCSVCVYVCVCCAASRMGWL